MLAPEVDDGAGRVEVVGDRRITSGGRRGPVVPTVEDRHLEESLRSGEQLQDHFGQAGAAGERGASWLARQAGGENLPFRRSISSTVKNGKVCSDGISAWVKGGR